eukprot:1621408-Amphidinium_carterae.1
MPPLQLPASFGSQHWRSEAIPWFKESSTMAARGRHLGTTCCRPDPNILDPILCVFKVQGFDNAHSKGFRLAQGHSCLDLSLSYALLSAHVSKN